MTREDAIKWIDDRMCFGRGTFTEHHPPNIDECWQAGMMAIEALQREEAEEKGYCHRIKPKELQSRPSGDLISREDAIDAICKSWCYVTYMDCPHADDGFRCDGCDDIEAIEALPSAEAVQGEWIIRENGNNECSLCGHERQDGWDYFCGYCGARMKGGDSE